MGTAFIIECGDQTRPSFLKIDARDAVVIWTKNANEALQMARKEDAENLSRMLIRERLAPRIHELTT